MGATLTFLGTEDNLPTSTVSNSNFELVIRNFPNEVTLQTSPEEITLQKVTQLQEANGNLWLKI